MTKLKSLGVAILVSSYAHAGMPQIDPSVCCISVSDKQAILGLSYKDFDQSLPDGGWRKFGNNGCYQTAEQLLEAYLATHGTQLDSSQTNVIIWHAGQIYGFDGNDPKAREDFVGSLNPKEPADSPVLWNDYVFASVAFLDHDLETLLAHRDRIARGPLFNGKKANLAVVDNLIKYFDKPYGVAASGGILPSEPIKCPLSSFEAGARPLKSLTSGYSQRGPRAGLVPY